MLWRRLANLSAPRRPANYRSGATLAQVRRNLGLGPSHAAAEEFFRYGAPDGGLQVEVRERVESQFMLQVVTTEFSARLPAGADTIADGPVRLELLHRGLIRRTGLRWRVRQGDPARLAGLLGVLDSDPRLQAILLPLDFKRLELRAAQDGWQVLIEPFGASEVICRMPRYRRYIRLSEQQAGLLYQALEALGKVVQEVASVGPSRSAGPMANASVER